MRKDAWTMLQMPKNAGPFCLLGILVAWAAVDSSAGMNPQRSMLGEAIQSGSQSRADGSAVEVSAIAPLYHLIAEPGGNMLVYNGSDMSVVMGVHRPSLVNAATELLRRLKAQPVRYALMMEDHNAVRERDGGWAAKGALTVAHEELRYRMVSDEKAGGVVRNALPLMGFSRVVQLYSTGEEWHFVHERAGYTDADVIVHCEKEGVLYLGNTFTTDGYPAIDATRFGTVDGVIATADHFVVEFGYDPAKVEPIVPGRGPLGTMKDLRAFRDMLKTIRSRVDEMVRRGLTIEEVVEAKPSADFDERWGAGPVTPEAFTRMVHRTVDDAWKRSRRSSK